MPRITYVAHDGTETQVEAAVGATLMSTAIDNDIRGIDGDCGGNCACATCHVYIEDERAGDFPPMEEMEDAMLEMTATREDSSRLGCQITVTEAMDGMIVRMPEAQN